MQPRRREGREDGREEIKAHSAKTPGSQERETKMALFSCPCLSISSNRGVRIASFYPRQSAQSAVKPTRALTADFADERG